MDLGLPRILRCSGGTHRSIEIFTWTSLTRGTVCGRNYARFKYRDDSRYLGESY
jgi:hypothetical protein